MKRLFVGLLGATALAFSIACAAGGTPAPGQPGAAAATSSFPPPLRPDQQVTISWTNYNVAAVGIGKEATEEMVANFQRKFPNIKVELRPVAAGDLIAKTQAEVVAGNPPDLAQFIFDDLGFVVQDLKARPLQTIVPAAEWDAYVKGEYPIHPRGLALTEIDKQVYGVPYVFSTPTLFYNADLFRQAGLDPNKPPKTWAELKEAGLQIRQRTGKLGLDFSDCLGRFDWCYQSIVLGNGGRVLSEDRTRLMFAEPAAVEATAMLGDLVKSGVSPLTALTAADGFSAGGVAMVLTTSVRTGAFLAASRGKWELRAAGMPAFGSKPTGPVNSGSGLFILSNDPVKQRAAWELMKYLTSEEGFTIITSKIGYLPLRPGIVSDARYLKPWADANPLLADNLRQLDSLSPWVSFPGPDYQQIRTLEMKAVDEVINGADPQKALTDAQTRAQALMPKK